MSKYPRLLLVLTSLFILLILEAASSVRSVAVEDKPFWTRPHHMKRIERGDVLALARLKKEGSAERFTIDTALVMNAPPQVAMEVIQEYNHWDQLVPSIQSSRLIRKGRLSVVRILSNVLGLYKMQMYMSFKENRSENGKWFFNWISIAGSKVDSEFEGSFLGMKGVIKVTPFSKNRSFVELYGDLIDTDIDVPSFLVQFGLEFVMRQAGSKIRKVVERRYKASEERPEHLLKDIPKVVTRHSRRRLFP